MKFIFNTSLAILSGIAVCASSAADEPYAAMLQELRAEITAKLPAVDAAARKSLIEAKDGTARVEAARKLPELDKFLSSKALDAKLAKHFILHDATPQGLAEYAAQGADHKKRIDALLADDELMLQIALADGARPLHVSLCRAPVAQYGKALEIYEAILKASPKAGKGVFQRLALAVSLELSEPLRKSNEAFDPDAPRAIDPVKRYLHYEKAYLDGELDPSFDQLSVWDLRFAICAPEPDEILAWGREMLRNFRPDHIYTENEGWRYAEVVNSDVKYGSIDVHKDQPDLKGPQNILMNGGICGRRAFFARYICRAFGVPATARPSSGHGASTRWSPQGWVVLLGPGWRHGWTSTRYRAGVDFVATTQARARGDEFLKVKRAFWVGDVMGEERVYAEGQKRRSLGFWNALSLATQGRIIEDSDAVTLAALGAELGEASGTTTAQQIMANELTLDARKITQGTDGTITIPAAAYAVPEGNTNEVIAMKSFAGGLQVFLPRFNQQQPILVRGGTYKHDSSLCDSATRHWKGRRPKNSYPMRGLRLAVSPSVEDPAKEMTLELSDEVNMEFVYIPAGKFIMGGEREDISKDRVALADTPKHEVTLTKGFYLGKYEMTQAQYAAVMGKEQGKAGKGPNYPVDGVKPSRALLLCENLTTRTGLDVRLPTEAEWEYAARAGTDTPWHFGDDPSKLGDYAWFKNNAENKSHPVGQKKPNAWGLYDMYGNIAEFVRDEHDPEYYANSPKVDPAGPLMGVYSQMEYVVEVPKSGNYALSARVATPNVEQSMQLAVNDAESVTHIKLPFTRSRPADHHRRPQRLDRLPHRQRRARKGRPPHRTRPPPGIDAAHGPAGEARCAVHQRPLPGTDLPPLPHQLHVGPAPNHLRYLRQPRAVRREGPFVPGKDLPWMTQRFEQAGYHVFTAGKILHGSANKPLGGTPCFKTGQGPYPPKKLVVPPEVAKPSIWDIGAYPETEEEYTDLRIAKWTASNISKPFKEGAPPRFMALGFYNPHLPLFAPKKWYDAAPSKKEVIFGATRDNDMDDLSAIAKRIASRVSFQAAADWSLETEDNLRTLTQAYLACTSAMDGALGHVIDQLDKSEMADNTWIVVLSDHGWHLGEKEHIAKQTLWTRSTRVPLIIVPPKRIKDMPRGVRCNQPVELLDIYPTLVAATGLETKPTDAKLDGLSLMPWLAEPTTKKERPAITTIYAHNHSVVDDRYRYTRYAEGSEEFYDRQTDPHEFDNLIESAKKDEKLAAIIQELASHIPKDEVGKPDLVDDRVK